MRNLFLLYILFNFQIGFSQTSLDGNYSGSDNEFGKLEIKFEKDSLFEYKHKNIFGLSIGSGKFEIIQNKLLLHFKKETQDFYDNYYLSNYEISEIGVAKKKDSVSLTFNIVDEHINEVFPGVNIMHKGKLLGYNDFSGLCEIKVPFSNKETYFRLKFVGAENLPINIIPDKDYQIKVWLHNSQDKLIEEETFEYTIEKSKRKRLILNNGYWDYKLRK
jgi:hypothetical protein